MGARHKWWSHCSLSVFDGKVNVCPCVVVWLSCPEEDSAEATTKPQNRDMLRLRLLRYLFDKYCLVRFVISFRFQSAIWTKIISSKLCWCLKAPCSFFKNLELLMISRVFVRAVHTSTCTLTVLYHISPSSHPSCFAQGGRGGYDIWSRWEQPRHRVGAGGAAVRLQPQVQQAGQRRVPHALRPHFPEAVSARPLSDDGAAPSIIPFSPEISHTHTNTTQRPVLHLEYFFKSCPGCGDYPWGTSSPSSNLKVSTRVVQIPHYELLFPEV